MGIGKQAKRVMITVAGGILLVVGVLLLVLPGPGLLLVLAGLLLLASEFPKLERYVDPVRDRAMKAAEESVSSPLRIMRLGAGRARPAGGGHRLGHGEVPAVQRLEHRIEPDPVVGDPVRAADLELPPGEVPAGGEGGQLISLRTASVTVARR